MVRPSQPPLSSLGAEAARLGLSGEKTQGDRFSVLTGQSHCGEFSLGDEKW